MRADLYDGVPVVALPLSQVDVPDPAHLRRSLRYPNAVDVDPDRRVLTDRRPGAGRCTAAT
jgi:hypothetical protein